MIQYRQQRHRQQRELQLDIQNQYDTIEIIFLPYFHSLQLDIQNQYDTIWINSSLKLSELQLDIQNQYDTIAIAIRQGVN